MLPEKWARKPQRYICIRTNFFACLFVQSHSQAYDRLQVKAVCMRLCMLIYENEYITLKLNQLTRTGQKTHTHKYYITFIRIWEYIF